MKVASTNYQGWHKIVVLETEKDAIVKYEDENEMVKNGVYQAIMNANTNLQMDIVWEKSKELDVTLESSLNSLAISSNVLPFLNASSTFFTFSLKSVAAASPPPAKCFLPPDIFKIFPSFSIPSLSDQETKYVRYVLNKIARQQIFEDELDLEEDDD